MSSRFIQKNDKLKLQFELNSEFSNFNKLVDFLHSSRFMKYWDGAKVDISLSEDKKNIDFKFRETFDFGKTHNGFDMKIVLPSVNERNKIENKPVFCEITNGFSEASFIMDGDAHENRIYRAVERLNAVVANDNSMYFSMNDMKMMAFTGKRDDDSLNEFLSIVKGGENIKETTAILENWNSKDTLILGNLFENDMNDVFHPQCNFLIYKFKRDTNSYLDDAKKNLSDEDMEIVVQNLIDDISENFDKTVAKVENGLRADGPFLVKYNECGNVDGVTYFDKCEATIYPTKIDGLFISKSQMGTDFDTNKYCYDVILIDGKQLAERANGGKYKVKGTRQKRTVNLLPDDKNSKQNDFVRKD